MKKDIHPQYDFVTVKLADGTEYVTRSTMGVENYTSDVDSSNHPFYTGKATRMDTAGRVEKFNRRYGRTKKSSGSAQEEPAQEEAGAEA